MNIPKNIILRLHLLMLMLMALAFTSCSDSSEPDSPEVTPQIIFLFSPGGLGDMSYNDCILEGVQRFKKANPDVDVFIYSPSTIEEAERIFSDWMKRPGSNIPVVFTLASSDYEPLVDRYASLYELTPNKRILLFESLKHYDDERIYTFQVSMYGASYLAGAVARECSEGKESLIVLGSSTDTPILSARDGFMAGNGNQCEVEFLADDWTGYVAPALTYRKMNEWGPKYGFIFPVAGGSNAGIYRYSREFEDSPFLAGMDIDQSGFSNKITGSVVKHFEILIVEYFNRWLETGTMPESQIYGLESKYVEWKLSPRYADRFLPVVESNMQKAIESERNYYEIGNN